jgi:hypothetical protein
MLAIAGCNDGGNSPISPTPVGGLSLEDLTVSLAADATAGVRQEGAAPAEAGGPAITLSGNDSIVNGGTLSVVVSAAEPFRSIYVYVAVPSEGIAGTAAGALQGHYEVQLPSPQTTATVLLSFPQEIALDTFEIQFGVADVGGEIGPYAGHTVSVIRVGTGDVQVTLSWDADSDVDLHVVAPNGQEVYYGQQQAAGGELDLDSNAACDIDGIRNENITWPTGQAPDGRYIVRVDYWSSCGVARTNYTVRINNGGNVRVFTGTFTGEGNFGGAGDGVTIATFDRSNGAPSITTNLAPTSATTVTSPAGARRSK